MRGVYRKIITAGLLVCSALTLALSAPKPEPAGKSVHIAGKARSGFSAHDIKLSKTKGADEARVKNIIISDRRDRLRFERQDFVDFELIVDGDEFAIIALRDDGTLDGVGLESFFGEERAEEIRSWKDIEKIFPDKLGNATHGFFAVREDGTVATIGDYKNYGYWTGVEKMSNSGYTCMVLREDGSVLVDYRDAVVELQWDGFVDVLATEVQLMALGADGRVYVPEEPPSSKNDYQVDWIEKARDVASIKSNGWMSCAIRTDGTVLPFYIDSPITREIAEGWENITQLALGFDQLLGLDKNGRVLSALLKNTDYYQEMTDELDSWRNIKKLYFSSDFGGIGNDNLVIGIKTDGSLEIYGWCEEALAPMLEWEDVVKIQGDSHRGLFVGLRSDGTLLSHSSDPYAR